MTVEDVNVTASSVIILQYVNGAGAPTSCDRLRPVATTGLHKGSIPARPDPVWPELRTATTYVARIFARLVLHDRAQAVVLAYESALVQPGAAAST